MALGPLGGPFFSRTRLPSVMVAAREVWGVVVEGAEVAVWGRAGELSDFERGHRPLNRYRYIRGDSLRYSWTSLLIFASNIDRKRQAQPV